MFEPSVCHVCAVTCARRWVESTLDSAKEIGTNYYSLYEFALSALESLEFRYNFYVHERESAQTNGNLLK